MDTQEVTKEVNGYDCSHAVITGGEPLLQDGLEEFCGSISDKHITIETNATVKKNIEADLISMSPKLSNSTPEGDWAERHEERRIDYDTIEFWIENYDYQLKFVVCEQEDIEEIEDILGSLKEYDQDRVLLMPEGTDRETLNDRGEWIADLCKERGYRYSPRLHIHMYGNKRGV
jgi:7-carboxy-7-deazaguanine synthase